MYHMLLVPGLVFLCTWCLDACLGWCMCLSANEICLLNSMYDGCFGCGNDETNMA